MKVIGLTGGIASGKSAVSSILRQLGAEVIDADVVARQVVAPGEPAWQRIVQAFGPEILKDDGNINRPLLGQIIFNDPVKRKILNEITHPEIIKSIAAEAEKYRAQNKKGQVVVIDAPLLLEVGLHKLVDEVWVIYVSPETQIERLMKRNNFTREQALARINSQMPLEEKLRFADRIINNDGSLANTRKQIEQLMKSLTE
ncbi:dephospho-CoA kinase [Thermincola ferriacetica]|uniref:Dephospho-CoA kinase n=2 Tax=Thermincola TaxID=278993 RepID=D5XDW1_THEPJ|nr:MULTISPECIES: dephospho-CoA kinase [Thermincola]ADG81832.1 dephospho-CoA kinase [Thermincola potens JR]KNZ70374.1 dephospho-CoA kinase [Thermincola ferriacetica]